jgi:hypothetical protein
MKRSAATVRATDLKTNVVTLNLEQNVIAEFLMFRVSRIGLMIGLIRRVGGRQQRNRPW